MNQFRAVVEWITKRKYLSLFLFILLVASIITGRIFVGRNSGKISEPLHRGDIVEAVYGIGTVTAYKRFSLNPLVGGTVQKIFIAEGDQVRKGAPLLQVEGGTIYRAPFDGIVNFFPYRTGENTYSTTPLLVLTNMTDRYIVVSMEQQGALLVKIGQKAKISFDSLRQSTFEGKVSAVYSYAGNFMARIDGIHLPESILPEMTCDVAIVIDVHKNALLIPVAAFENGQVWLKRGKSIPHQIPVKIGITDGVWAEVLEGDLKPGDRLMIRKQVSQ